MTNDSNLFYELLSNEIDKKVKEIIFDKAFIDNLVAKAFNKISKQKELIESIESIDPILIEEYIEIANEAASLDFYYTSNSLTLTPYILKILKDPSKFNEFFKCEIDFIKNNLKNFHMRNKNNQE